MTNPRVLNAEHLGQALAAGRSAGRKDRAEILTGQVSDIDASGIVTVTIRGIDRTDLIFSTVPVAIGDTVLIVQQDGLAIVVGPTASTAMPITGTVSAVPSNSSTITVATAAGNVSAIFPASYTTPTVGDSVYLVWIGSTALAHKVGQTGTPPAPTPTPAPAPKPPPPTTVTTGTTLFVATDVGTYRVGDGWRDDDNGDVIQGTAPGFAGLNSGAWFYGGRVHSSLAGATVLGAQIYLGRTSGGTFAAQNAHVQRVTDNVQPSGAPTFAGSATDIALAVGQEGWFAIPAALAQSLVDSSGSLGIQAPSGPYMRMFGLSKSGSAGALKISWRR